MARSTITLREPDEVVVIADDSEWRRFGFAQHGVALIGDVEGKLRTIPWWRVVEVATTEGGTITNEEHVPSRRARRNRR